MGLNYSHRPVSRAHISEDNPVSPVRIGDWYLAEGVSEKNVEIYSRSWNVSRLEAGDLNFSCGRDCCSSLEPTSVDIVDRLPSDPFGMDIETTFTAITGWLEDLKVDLGGYNYMSSNNGMFCQEGYGLFAGWIWNHSFTSQSLSRTIQLNTRLSSTVMLDDLPSGFQFALSTYEDDVGLAPYDVGLEPASNVEYVGCSLDMESAREVEGASEFEREPHEAFTYVLGYLGVKDLLSVERVCSSLSSAVRGDPLFWKTIHIHRPLCERITDVGLMQLAGRAQGNLECLSLVECFRITNDGLKRVLEANRRLTKFRGPIRLNYSLIFIKCCI